MTAIAAVVSNGLIWMGGDSLGSHPSGISHLGLTKIWKEHKGNSTWLFGCAGAMAYLQALRYEVELPAETPGANTCEYIIRAWAKSVREHLQQKRPDLVDKDGNVRGNSQVLIGLNGQLFIMVGFAVYPIPQPYAAIGEGGSAAYGVLHFIHRRPSGIRPKAQLRHALQAADDRFSSVGGDYKFLHV